MSGLRRIGGELLPLGDDWLAPAPQRPRWTYPSYVGPKRGYQIRPAVGTLVALWWVDYHTSNGEEGRKLAVEQLVGLYSTEREAELAARKRMGGS